MIKKIAFFMIMSLIAAAVHAQTPLNFRDCYVIVLDVQPEYYSNTKLNDQAGEMVKNINTILDRTDPGKVIYVRSPRKMLSISLKGISTEILPPTSLDSNLRLTGATQFTKMSGDAFEVPELLDFLSRRKAHEIILTGLLAEKCIYHTALGGTEKGFAVQVVPEAILAKNDKSKDKTLRKMKEKGVILLSLKEITGTSRLIDQEGR